MLYIRKRVPWKEALQRHLSAYADIKSEEFRNKNKYYNSMR